MRVIETGLPGVVRAAFTGGGRLLVASTGDHALLTVWDWVAGECVFRVDGSSLLAPVAASPDGEWVAAYSNGLTAYPTDGRPPVPIPTGPGRGFAGGLAFTPDGRTLAASRSVFAPSPFGSPARLRRWSVGDWRPQPDFDLPEYYHRMAYSPDGEFLAGINAGLFELRYARSGGIHAATTALDHRPTPHGRRTHLAFAPRGSAVAFGWNDTLHLTDAAAGKVVAHLYDPDVPFRDAAFTADGRRLGTVGDDGAVRLWDARSGAAAGRYDWDAGPLRCLTFAPDGSVGACGTADGRLVLFDVDV